MTPTLPDLPTRSGRTAVLLPAGALQTGSAREALRLSAAVLYEAQLRGRPYEMVAALSHMARCYRGIDAPGAARGMLLEALRWAGAMGGVDTTADLTCELAETTCLQAEVHESLKAGSGQADRDLARDHAFDALQMVSRVSDPGWESRLLLRLADVLDRCGDHADAASLQGMAIQRMGDLPSDFSSDQSDPPLDRSADEPTADLEEEFDDLLAVLNG